MKTDRSVRSVALVFALFAAALPGFAQEAAQQVPQQPAQPSAQQPGKPVLHQPAAQPTAAAIPVTVKEVNLPVVVRNKKGEPVNDLGKQDFVLEQDGRAQTITQLVHEGDLPLTVGILAETGPGQRKALADERKSGIDFVNQLRENKDRGFVLHFDKEVELLQDLTTSHDKLAKGVDEISVGDTAHNSGSGRKRDDPQGQQPHYFFGGSTLYDAIFLSSDEVLKGQKGRKAVVLFSDGVDRGSKTSLEGAIESAQRADTAIYCVLVANEREQEQGQDNGGRRAGGGYPGGGYPGGGGPFPGGGSPFPGGGYPGGRRRGPDSNSGVDEGEGKKALQRIAGETGGRFFELSKKLTAAQVYTQIKEEMQHQYSLSYMPDKAGNGYHKLHLTTRNAELTVQTRAGFYSE